MHCEIHLVPSITYIANTFGGLLGGSMITESVFSVPGIGSYALTAINNRDYIAIQGYVLFTRCCLCSGLPAGRPDLRLAEPADSIGGLSMRGKKVLFILSLTVLVLSCW